MENSYTYMLVCDGSLVNLYDGFGKNDRAKAILSADRKKAITDWIFFQY